MTKRERLLEYLKSEQPGDYVPAAFFMHFGENFTHGKPAIDRHIEFFRSTEMDFAKIQFELSFPKVEIGSCEDFDRVYALPISFYRPQLEVAKDLVDALKDEALVVLTLYSPFMILAEMVGRDLLIGYLQQDPEPVFEALARVAESLLAFVVECKSTGLDGFYHSTQGGESHRFNSPEIFLKWVKPIDHLVMNEIDRTFTFNILHICDYHQEYGGYQSLEPFLDYPGHVVNVSTAIGGRALSPSEISSMFKRPYLGGMNRLGALSKGSEGEARTAARKALENAPARFILGADCTVPAETPWENLRAAIAEAHESAHCGRTLIEPCVET